MAYKSRIPQIAATLDARVTAAMRTAAEQVEQDAKARVPVATGGLRDAIHTEMEGDSVSVIAGDDDVFYGHLVEYGTSRVPARPFLVPALESNRDNILASVNAALRTL
jgi:HK97 gp10 family phage protein